MRSHYESTIRVAVGKDDGKESFVVHEDLFSARSTFIKAAVAKGWKEAEEKTLCLPEHRAIVFKCYLEAAYSRNLDLVVLAKENADTIVSDEEDDFDAHPQFRALAKTGHALVRFYMLGGFLGDVAFKNEVVKAVLTGYRCHVLCFYTQAMRLSFDATPTDCGLQKLVADTIAHRMDTTKTVDWLAHVSLACVLAVLKATVEERYGDLKPAEWDVQKYLEVE